jgi:hypothetical protein
MTECVPLMTGSEANPIVLSTESEGRLEKSLAREVVGRDLSASVEMTGCVSQMTGWCVPDDGMVCPR